MSENRQLATIIDNMPKYEDCRKEFFEHFYMFQKLGCINYASLAEGTGFATPAHEMVGIFLAGLALGKASEISERESCDLKMDVWSALVAWGLVEDELSSIRPQPRLPRLPEPASIDVEVKAPGRRRKRSN
jgi:hypothetical protein